MDEFKQIDALEGIAERNTLLSDQERGHIMDAARRIRELEEEVRIGDTLLAERNRLLATIPGCDVHGQDCVPHAIEWVQGMLKAKEAPLNLNTQFEATLTGYGACLYNDHYAALRTTYPDVAPPLKQAGDTVTMELWHYMEVFGPHCYHGMPEAPVVGNVIRRAAS